MANKMTLTIAGMNLIINTSEDEAFVKQLCAQLNSDISGVMEANPSTSLSNASLLCSLEYLARCDKANKSANSLRAQIKDYLTDANRSKLEADEAVRKNEDLASENAMLRERVTRLAASETNSIGTEDALRKQLESANNETTAVRRQLRDMSEQNSAMETTISAQKDTITSKNSELSRFADVINQQAAKIDSLTKQFDDLKQSAEALLDDRKKLQDKITSLMAECKTANAETASEKEKYETLQESIHSLENEKAEMEALLNEAFADTDRMKREVQAKDDIIVGLRSMLESITNTCKDEPEEAEEAEAAMPAPAEPVAATLPVFDEPDEEDEVIEEETDEFLPYEVPDYTQEESSEDELEECQEYDEFVPENEEIADRLVNDPVYTDSRSTEVNRGSSNSRFFDAEAEDFNQEEKSEGVGVGDDFKTFGQMIAEENKRSKMAEISEGIKAKAKEKMEETEDDDMLPDLSWINDID